MATRRVLISDPIEQVAVDILQDAGIAVDRKAKLSEADLLSTIADYDGLIVRSGTQVTEAVIDAASKLKVIGRAGTGVDNIDCQAATRRGVVVMNTPGGNTLAAAEHTVAMLMSLARNVAQGDASMKAGKWDRKKFMGVELNEKTLGVLGLGRVGREVVSRCQAFGMKVVGYDPFINPAEATKLGIEPVSAAEAMRRCDFLTIHVPLLDSTRNLINTESIATMKAGVRIVNCARGGIIDEAALLAALKTGHVAGAALDVFESEPPAEHELALIAHPSVVATPHLGASTVEAQARVAAEISTEMAKALLGADKPLVGVVNAPDLTLSQKPELKPWTALCENMGSLLAQRLENAQVRRIHVGVTGELLASAGSLCAAAAIKGIYHALTGEQLNLINAPAVARERHIAISNGKDQDENYTSLVSLEVETSAGKSSMAGSLFHNRPRVCRMDGHDIEFALNGGYYLVYANLDKPGMAPRPRLLRDWVSSRHSPASLDARAPLCRRPVPRLRCARRGPSQHHHGHRLGAQRGWRGARRHVCGQAPLPSPYQVLQEPARRVRRAALLPPAPRSPSQCGVGGRRRRRLLNTAIRPRPSWPSHSRRVALAAWIRPEDRAP